MASRAYKRLAMAAKQACSVMTKERHKPAAQLPVFYHYDFNMKRGTQLMNMTLWGLGFVMKVTVANFPLRYQLYLTTKGEFVGYVQQDVQSAIHGMQRLCVLSVLSPEHFDQLSEEDHARLLLELETLGRNLGAPV